jgi:hypothetical protein
MTASDHHTARHAYRVPIPTDDPGGTTMNVAPQHRRVSRWQRWRTRCAAATLPLSLVVALALPMHGAGYALARVAAALGFLLAATYLFHRWLTRPGA